MKRIVLFISLFISIILASAQTFEWAKNMDGISGTVYAYAVEVDNSGNVYTTGYFDGRVDFDPGAGTFYLTAATSDHDIFITKTDASGNFVWAKSMGGYYDDAGTAVALDGSGNVYITGNFDGLVDFDPGPGIFNLSTSGSGQGMFICKLDPSGNFVWAKGMTGTSASVVAGSIKINGSGNIFTTGSFFGTVDFDPGAGTSLLTAAGAADVFISKLDASGNLVWVKSFSGTSYENGKSIAIDVSGNVLTTGYFNGTVDFDPGAGVVNLSGVNNDIFISKLDASGNFVWAKMIGNAGTDYGNAIVADGSGNVLTAGFFSNTVDFDPDGSGTFNLTAAGPYDAFVLKLDASGNFSWAKQFAGTSNEAVNSMALDVSGNILTTGYFFGTTDFDPGAGSYNLVSSSGYTDIFISKLDASGNFVWAKQLGGAFGDNGYSIAVDAPGNIFTTGNFYRVADFDPGAGTYNLIASGNFTEQFISKLNSSGNFVWAKSAGIGAAAIVYDIATDASGNVFSTGYFFGTIDFDPGGGINNLTSVSGSFDIFVCKSDASGNFVWAKQLGGTGDDNGNSVVVDGSGNVYTTGYFNGTADFDPGAATYNLISSGYDIFISKLNASGNFVWAKRIGGTNNDLGYSIAIDASGSVLTTGYFAGTVDFDPGAATSGLTASGSYDVFVSKLDAAGNFVWAKNMGGTSGDYGASITTDASGNVFTTGYYYSTGDFDPGAGTYNLTSSGVTDIFVSKLDAAGNFVWAKSMGGKSGDYASSIAVDPSGNVLTTGRFPDTVDFDPGPGIYNLVSAGGVYDIFVSKLNASGNFVWAKRIGNTGNDEGNAVATDAAGNVYFTGKLGISSYNIYISKVDASGTTVWEKTLTGYEEDIGNSIAVDPLNNIYTAGSFAGTVDFDPGTGTYNLTPLGKPDAFILKMSLCTMPSAGITPAGPVTFCSGGNVVLNANTGTGLTYQWKNNGADISGATNQNYAATASGSYTVVVTNSCGAVTSSATTVTVNSLPSATLTPAGPTTFCSGGSVVLNTPGGANKTYQWKKGANLISGATSSSYTATTGGNYRVIVTNTVTGCSKTTNSATTVTVNALPAATITPQGPTTFCAGGSVVLQANTGAGLTYKWKKGTSFISGATLSNYTATTGGNYKVQVTNSNGCSKISANVAVSVPCKEAEKVISENNFDVKVFPNPSSRDFVFEFSNAANEKISIEIFDAIGQKILSGETNDIHFMIHDAQLAKGIYSVEIISGTDFKNLKIIKSE